MVTKPSTFRALLMVLCLTMTTACSGESREYDFGISVAGGPTGWPVRVEELTFDNNWSAPGGILRGGFDHSPPGGAMVILSPKPAPNSVQARWYSYRTKTFHQIDLSLPEDFSDRVEEWYEEFPQPHYLHTLIVGFSGKGEALVWWEAFCLQCDQDRSQDFSTPIVENAQASVVGGDASQYRSQTEQFINEGLFPNPGE
ncbi:MULTISPECIES: DUF2931 family protein [unclassified Halomonas]|uniref:DUF2931 family protein n=1 Tax=unclassified Halomonas TaxID=2609666 RepID=UPI0007DA232C|nr:MULTISPECIES: DUF2931 family protein [unclassified Halomonas]MBT2788480.1 DUF2931 family protein [Halomonas sp. ISL-106]MBT2798071.1 DUF2931 family protein [Halomonas sp. ISL-104]OAL60631.1 hypothetical protein A6R74_18090 [Halomonas sp. ALS9]